MQCALIEYHSFHYVIDVFSSYLFSSAAVFLCPLKYIGHTGRTFNITYKEHISGYSNHILNTVHTYGTITDTMDIIRTGRKGKQI
jgi:hypothetical protein